MGRSAILATCVLSGLVLRAVCRNLCDRARRRIGVSSSSIERNDIGAGRPLWPSSCGRNQAFLVRFLGAVDRRVCLGLFRLHACRATLRKSVADPGCGSACRGRRLGAGLVGDSDGLAAQLPLCAAR